MYYYSKSLAFIGLAVAAPATNAFTLTSPSIAASRHHSSLDATRDPSHDAIRNLAAASALTLGLLFQSPDAFAAQVPLTTNDHALHSSTVGLSVEIKTMDFSMPSSYDSIAAPVASGTEELTQSTVVTTSAPAKKKSAPKAAVKKEKKEKKASPAASGLSAKEASEAARAERKAEREAKEAEQSARDKAAALETQENIKAAREAKIAARAAAKAEQEAAEAAAQDDARLKGAKFVDTSMPSY